MDRVCECAIKKDALLNFDSACSIHIILLKEDGMKNHLKAETWKRLPEVVSGEAVVPIVVVALTPVFEMEYV